MNKYLIAGFLDGLEKHAQPQGMPPLPKRMPRHSFTGRIKPSLKMAVPWTLVDLITNPADTPKTRAKQVGLTMAQMGVGFPAWSTAHRHVAIPLKRKISNVFMRKGMAPARAVRRAGWISGPTGLVAGTVAYNLASGLVNQLAKPFTKDLRQEQQMKRLKEMQNM